MPHMNVMRYVAGIVLCCLATLLYVVDYQHVATQTLQEADVITTYANPLTPMERAAAEVSSPALMALAWAFLVGGVGLMVFAEASNAWKRFRGWWRKSRISRSRIPKRTRGFPVVVSEPAAGRG